MEDNDPVLLELFAASEKPLPAEAFIDKLEQRMERRRRTAYAGWFAVGITLILFGWLLAGPLHSMSWLISRGLASPLIHLPENALIQLLIPINTLAAPVALLVVLSGTVLRKILR